MWNIWNMNTWNNETHVPKFKKDSRCEEFKIWDLDRCWILCWPFVEWSIGSWIFSTFFLLDPEDLGSYLEKMLPDAGVSRLCSEKSYSCQAILTSDPVGLESCFWSRLTSAYGVWHGLLGQFWMNYLLRAVGRPENMYAITRSLYHIWRNGWSTVEPKPSRKSLRTKPH